MASRACPVPVLSICWRHNSLSKGWFPVSRNFYVRTCVKFTFANKIEAMHEKSLVSVKVEPRSSSRLSSALLILPLFCLRDWNVRALTCVAKNAPVEINLRLDDCTTGLNDAIARLENYSTDSYLGLNAKKTKWMILSTTRMSRVHRLDSCNFEYKLQRSSFGARSIYKVALTTSWPTSEVERAYHQNTRVMLRDTGSSKKTDAFGSM